MTDYNDGKWHIHEGDECPVHRNSEVEVIWRAEHLLAGVSKDTKQASQVMWASGMASSVIAFRVTKQHREPFEIWLRQGILSGEWHPCRPEADGALRFREVLE